MNSDERRDFLSKLEKNGFIFVRRANHGLLWKREDETIMVPNANGSSDHRALRNLKSEFDRIMENLGTIEHDTPVYVEPKVIIKDRQIIEPVAVIDDRVKNVRVENIQDAEEVKEDVKMRHSPEVREKIAAKVVELKDVKNLRFYQIAETLNHDGLRRPNGNRYSGVVVRQIYKSFFKNKENESLAASPEKKSNDRKHSWIQDLIKDNTLTESQKKSLFQTLKKTKLVSEEAVSSFDVLHNKYAVFRGISNIGRSVKVKLNRSELKLVLSHLEQSKKFIDSPSVKRK